MLTLRVLAFGITVAHVYSDAGREPRRGRVPLRGHVASIEVPGRLSAASVSIVPRSYAVRKIRQLRRIVREFTMDEGDVDGAISKPGKDFEDSLQYHCARANGVSVIVTRNADDFLTKELHVVSPEEFMVMDFSGKSTR